MASNGARRYLFHERECVNRNLPDTQCPWTKKLLSVVDTCICPHDVHLSLLTKCQFWARIQCLCAGLRLDSVSPPCSSCGYFSLYAWLILLQFNFLSFSMHMAENAFSRALKFTCITQTSWVRLTDFLNHTSNFLEHRILGALLWFRWSPLI